MTASPPAASASKGRASTAARAKTVKRKQYWLKPQGDPDDPSSLQQAFSGERYLIGFARRPSGVRVGDVLLVYRIGVAAIQYAAEAVDECRKATAAEIEREPWRERWSWLIEARNLTPEFGAAWSQRSLHIRALANAYDKQHPDAPLSLGTLNYGADKVRVPEDFAVGVLERMRSGRYVSCPCAPGARP